MPKAKNGVEMVWLNPDAAWFAVNVNTKRSLITVGVVLPQTAIPSMVNVRLRLAARARVLDTAGVVMICPAKCCISIPTLIRSTGTTRRGQG